MAISTDRQLGSLKRYTRNSVLGAVTSRSGLIDRVRWILGDS